MHSLEAQLLEEPLVLAFFVGGFELDASLETVSFPLGGILQVLGGQLLETNFAGGVTSGHQVIVVQYLQERLDLGLLLQLGLAHALGNLAGVSVDTSDQGVTEWLIGCTIVNSFDNDGFTAGVTSTKDNYDFVLFHNLPHLAGCWNASGGAGGIKQSSNVAGNTRGK